jgi:hypothetical protein
VYLLAALLLEEKAVPVRLETPAQVNGQVGPSPSRRTGTAPGPPSKARARAR